MSRGHNLTARAVPLEHYLSLKEIKKYTKMNDVSEA